LQTIYFIDNKIVLENLNNQLFQTKEYKELNLTGKNMYSSAFDNYINFVNGLYNSSKEVINEAAENNEVYSKKGKLLKITNLDLLKQLEPYIETNRLLSAAQIVGNYYKDQYKFLEPHHLFRKWVVYQ
jgi:hypothetical protein